MVGLVKELFCPPPALRFIRLCFFGRTLIGIGSISMPCFWVRMRNIAFIKGCSFPPLTTARIILVFFLCTLRAFTIPIFDARSPALRLISFSRRVGKQTAFRALRARVFTFRHKSDPFQTDCNRRRRSAFPPACRRGLGIDGTSKGRRTYRPGRRRHSVTGLRASACPF